jgi:uncharacterized protein YrzB (UPF0473 family)
MNIPTNENRKEKNTMADENKPFEENGEEDEDLIELVDEDGESTFFEHLATLEYKGDTYLALCEPENEDEEKDSLEVFFLKIETDENGEDYYTTPDDKVADEVFEEFLKLVEDTAE